MFLWLVIALFRVLPVYTCQKSSRSFCRLFNNPSFYQYLRRFNRFVLTCYHFSSGSCKSYRRFIFVCCYDVIYRNRRNSNVLRPGGGPIYFLGIFLIPSLPAFKFPSLAKGFHRLISSVGGGGASDDGPAAGSENEERYGTLMNRRPCPRRRPPNLLSAVARPTLLTHPLTHPKREECPTRARWLNSP
jgi:hypothetical protein